MLALLLTPAALSLLVLAAHFLRRGEMLQCLAALTVLGALLFLRLPWVPRLVQAVLAVATVLWVMTLGEMVKLRQAAHEPAGRLVVILGSVIAVNVLAALLLGTKRVRDRYPADAPPEPPPA